MDHRIVAFLASLLVDLSPALPPICLHRHTRNSDHPVGQDKGTGLTMSNKTNRSSRSNRSKSERYQSIPAGTEVVEPESLGQVSLGSHGLILSAIRGGRTRAYSDR